VVAQPVEEAVGLRRDAGDTSVTSVPTSQTQSLLFLNPHLLEQSRASLSAIYFQQFTKAPPGSLLELSCAGLRLDKEHRVRP
jgi:hypothetical protein